MLKLNLSKKLFSLSASALLALSLNAADCSKKAFDIKVKEDTSAAEIINQLSNICNFSVVYKDAYSKNILGTKQDGINIKNMHINGIFDLLISEQGLYYDFYNNILRIQGMQTKTYKLDYITSIRRGSAVTKANLESQNSENSNNNSSSDGESENIIETKEEFDFWKNIGKEISDIIQSSGNNIGYSQPIINSNAGLITVTANSEILSKIDSYLNQVQESLKKQVIIDVSIIEVELEKQNKTGIDWTKFNLGFDTTGLLPGFSINDITNGIIFGGAGSVRNKTANYTGFQIGKTHNGRWNGKENINMNIGVNLTGMINFLKQSGDVKVVSSPKIATLNNQQALITVGNTYNYKLKGSSTTTDSGTTGDADEEKSIFVGILLNILPEISDDNKIMLRINPSVSELVDNDDAYVKDRSVAPDTKQKKISTVVQVRDGETIVLGGLIADKEEFGKNGVPILQDIPVVGKIFGSKKVIKGKRELVFVITPHIVDFSKDKAEVRKSLEDLGYSLSLDYKDELKPSATKNIFKEKSEKYDLK